MRRRFWWNNQQVALDINYDFYVFFSVMRDKEEKQGKGEIRSEIS